ncbi:hypothetical protein [Klebsiella pneumoniae]|uniref:hypothetical protein n=1 Tax=Klebsiella pneumoniae TaxID=573 RepID=UPI0025A3DC10|nr:hypothetical protein [Klebsiella pneumoniae]MDM8064610.1 hypothetical protein [Klebsiella pneumoniae]MDM8093599.1 hypothetical protein [Klebsiella pneumoniae]
MTSKFTREELLNIIDTDHVQCGEASALARMVLSAMESEPVFTLQVSQADYKGQKLGNHFGFITLDAARELKEGNYQLYTAQPAPVAQCPYPCGWDTLNKLAIQDAAFVALALVAGEPATESIRSAVISNNDRLLKVISFCRDVMPQAGNSPAIPDGYVMVPKEPTAEMIWAAKYCFTSTPGWDVFKSAYIAMLAAAPQEVNHG